MNAIKVNMNDSKLSESEIVSRILKGEKELYEILLRRNNQKLYRVIRSYINESNEIDDIIQNTHLKAYEKLHQFKHDSQYSTWLIRIAINESLARLKEKGKISSINGQANNIETSSIMQLSNKNQPSPAEKIIRQESKAFIEKTIDTLESKYKVVFILKEVEGMSINEIASSLDLSNSNVKVRLHRSKAILKDKLLQLYSNRDIFEFGFNRCDSIVEHVMRKIL